MSGRHSAPGSGRFISELAVFALKVVFWGALIFGAILLVQSLFGGDDEAAATTTTSTSTAFTTTQATPTTGGTTTTAPTTTTTAETTTTTAAPTTTETTATTVPPVRNPQDVTVLVLNSTRRAGLAAGLTEFLRQFGYQLLEPTNYDTPLDTSRVWYTEGFEAEAVELALQAVPDAIVEPFTGITEANIVVVLGASYAG